MSFILGIYLGFLCVAALFYYSVPNKYKHLILALSSLTFITYISWKFAIYAVAFSTFNYFSGILIYNNRSNIRIRKRIFWFSIFVDIGFLAFFKYFGLFQNLFEHLFFFSANSTNDFGASIIIPLGVSYYTFQALGYIIRINRGSEKSETDFLKFLTYLLFFPKFISGPVERSNHFFPQINKLGSFNANQVYDGLRLLLWGAFKKIVIASALYSPVQQVYKNVYGFTGIELIIVFFLQSVYIYMEFSGYTDMALGSAKVLGINLIDNFNRPFLARNISDFWRRWHISLSSWCNDFIYSPFIVKYRKHENFAIVTGVFLTFFVVGIWHAANLTFVVLGLLQGVAIVYEFYTKKARIKFASRFSKSLVTTLSRIIVFFFVCTSMVFFFSPSISEAWFFFSHLLSFDASLLNLDHFPINGPMFIIALVCFGIIFIIELSNEKGKNVYMFFKKQHVVIQWFGYALLVVAIYFSQSTIFPFEYMKF